MLKTVLKFPNESMAIVEIPKLVISSWPLYLNGILQRESYLNISITVHNLENSPIPISGCQLIFPKESIENVFQDISSTLLDKRNPLTTSYTGLYDISNLPSVLKWYDGIPNILVDMRYKTKLINLNLARAQLLQVKFNEILYPGRLLVFRFICKLNSLYIEDKNGIFISFNVFENSILKRIQQSYKKLKIDTQLIPIKQYYNKEKDGGYDLFLHIPTNFDAKEVNEKFIKSGILNYNVFGSNQGENYRRYAINTEKFFINDCHPCDINHITNNDQFIFQFSTTKDYIMQNNSINIGSITGVNFSVGHDYSKNIKSYNTQNDWQFTKDKIYDLLSKSGLNKNDKETAINAVERLDIASKTSTSLEWLKNLNEFTSTIRGLGSAGAEFINSITNIFQ